MDSTRSRETSVALRNGLKMGASLIITWSVALIVKLRIPAHLGPVRQGHLGFAESFAALFFCCLGLGIDMYVIKEVAVRPKHASDILGGVFLLRLVMSVALFAAMMITLWVTGRPMEVILAAAVFGGLQIVASVNSTLGCVLQAVSKVGAAAVSSVVAKVVWGAGLLVGLHYDASLPVLALPALIAEILRAFVLVPATARAHEVEYRIDVPAVRAAIVESFPYFVNALALGILGSLVMSTLEFIRVDEREVGWFAAVQNLAYLCNLLSPLISWVIMPLMARARARSHEEGMAVFRRCLEGVVVTIVPVTVLVSAGADVLVRVAFGAKYAPAHTGLSILSLVFMMTYMNTMLAMKLIIIGRGWSVTVISCASVLVSAGLLFLFVPLGRHLIGEGGECAGAAASVIGSESCVLVAMLFCFETFPLDARNISAFTKSVVIAAIVLVFDRQIRALGASRLVVDGLLYAILALAAGVVHVKEVSAVVRLLKNKGVEPSPPVTLAGS